MISRLANFMHLKVPKMPYHAFISSFVMLMITVVIAPVLFTGFYRAIFMQTCFYVLMATMLWSCSRERMMLYWALALAIPFIILDVFGIAMNSFTLLLFSQFVLTGFLLLSILMLVRQISSARVFDTNLIFGAIMIYLLAGIVWAKAYWFVDIFFPESFKGLEQLIATHQLTMIVTDQFNLFYYSFSTITTLGLGDIVPQHQYVRLLTVIEAVFGQLFVAITIAKIVSVCSISVPKPD